MSQLLDRVQVSTATTGTGTVALGSATVGFQTFGAGGAVNGAIYSYLILDTGNAWEIGFGTYSSAAVTLTRTLVSSSTGALLNLTGAATISVVASAGVGTTGGWQLISEVVTTASQPSVTFSSIPQTFRDLKMVCRGRGDTALTGVSIDIQLNGDTAANYVRQYVDAVGSTLSTGTLGAVANVYIGRIPAANATANFPGMAEAIIYDYRGTTFAKVVNGRAVNIIGSGSFELVWQGNLWTSTAAVNAIKVFTDAGNFVNGSVVSLYGSQ